VCTEPAKHIRKLARGLLLPPRVFERHAEELAMHDPRTIAEQVIHLMKFH
jgi:hypothetical protein